VLGLPEQIIQGNLDIDFAVFAVNGGRGQQAAGRFCNGDLCPAPKTFRLKARF